MMSSGTVVRSTTKDLRVPASVASARSSGYPCTSHYQTRQAWRIAA
jgi:hypothetical protein